MIIINKPCKVVREALDSITDIDGVTTGVLPPFTVRFLTKENKFVNIGLEEVSENSCSIGANINSFEVKDNQIQELHDKIMAVLKDS